MGAHWLREMENVFRGDNPDGFNILTIPGWQNISRSTGGYDDVRGFVMHHTAEGSSSDGWPSANFQTFQDADRPNVGLYLSRHPRAANGGLFICAAGACNTQGKGGPRPGPRGGVPVDRGNTHMAALEIGNNGSGEPYSAEQQDAILWVVSTWYRRIGIPRFGMNPASDLCAHFEWAPTRKIDPSGPCRWAPNGGKWNMDAFRGDVVKALATQEDDVTPEECRAVVKDEVAAIVSWVATNGTGTKQLLALRADTAKIFDVVGVKVGADGKPTEPTVNDRLKGLPTGEALTVAKAELLAAIAAIDAGSGVTEAQVETAVRKVFADAGTA